MKNSAYGHVAQVLTALAVVCLIASAAWAQPPGPPPGMRPDGLPPGMGPDGPPPDSAEARELMEQVMVTRLTRTLNLSDEQSVLLVRRFSEAREKQQALMRERAELLHQLRLALQAQKNPAEVEALLARIIEQDNRIGSLRHRMFETMAGTDLDIWQRGQLMLFMHEFEHEMRRIARQAQHPRHGMDRPGQGPPPGPGIDPDTASPDRPQRRMRPEGDGPPPQRRARGPRRDEPAPDGSEPDGPPRPALPE